MVHVAFIPQSRYGIAPLIAGIGVLAVTSVVLVQSFSASAKAQVPTGYAIRDSTHLVASANGVDGQLQLLEDERLTPAIRSAVLGGGLWMGLCDYDPQDEALRSFCRSLSVTPLREAALRVVDNHGNVLDEFRANRWVGQIAVRSLVRNAPVTYLITIDRSAGWGSYSGPVTSFVDVRDGSLQWLTAQRVDAPGSQQIRVMRSLKTAWQMVPARSGAGTDILEFACRPDFAAATPGETELPFLVRFRRYYYRDGQWWLAERTEPGFWEDDWVFPDPSQFP